MRRSELGCPPFGPIFALGAAIEYLSAIGVDKIEGRVLFLNELLTYRLAKKGFVVLSPSGSYRSGQTLVAVDDPEKCVAFLRDKGILVTPKPQGIRISTHFYNNEEDVETVVQALVGYLKK
jgi:selenocysteine lyase/cysteine desulfurase